MSNVIEIDDEEEDVEVVYSNITETLVKRNLVYQKISKELELLQAISKYEVPLDLDLFKALARNVGFKHGDHIVHSAWERVMKKHLTNLNTSQSYNTATSGLHSSTHLSQINQPSSISSRTSLSCSNLSALSVAGSLSPTPTISMPSSQFPITPNVIPVALITNSTLCRSELTNETIQRIDNRHKPDFITADISDNLNNQCLQELETVAKSFKTKKRKSKGRANRKSIGDMNDLGKNEERKWTSYNPIPDFLEHSESRSNAVLGEAQSNIGTGFLDNYHNGESSLPSYSGLSKSKNTKKTDQKYSNIELRGKNDQLIIKSHVGVKAKIIKSKRSSKKKLSKQIKGMSEAEMKEFKAEQKRLKLLEKHEFETIELQKVHDRLVDVLLPKYYNKEF